MHSIQFIQSISSFHVNNCNYSCQAGRRVQVVRKLWVHYKSMAERRSISINSYSLIILLFGDTSIGMEIYRPDAGMMRAYVRFVRVCTRKSELMCLMPVHLGVNGELSINLYVKFEEKVTGKAVEQQRKIKTTGKPFIYTLEQNCRTLDGVRTNARQCKWQICTRSQNPSQLFSRVSFSTKLTLSPANNAYFCAPRSVAIRTQSFDVCRNEHKLH